MMQGGCGQSGESSGGCMMQGGCGQSGESSGGLDLTGMMSMMNEMMAKMGNSVPEQGKGMGKQGKGLKPGDWSCPSCGDHQFAKNQACRKCGTPKPATYFGMKSGDWHCPNCSDLQFAKNLQCRKCGTPNPDPERAREAMEIGLASSSSARLAPGIVEKPGDWYCPMCGDLQFARNNLCRRCGTANPDPEGSKLLNEFSKANNVAARPGDWHCPGCGDLQFAKNLQCRKCGTPNPDPGQSMGLAKQQFNAKPGDWHCTSCGDLQFAKNATCRKCGTPNFAAVMKNMMGMLGMGMNAMMGTDSSTQPQMMAQLMNGSTSDNGTARSEPY